MNCAIHTAQGVNSTGISGTQGLDDDAVMIVKDGGVCRHVTSAERLHVAII